MNQETIQAFVQARTRRPAWFGIDPPLRPTSIDDAYRLPSRHPRPTRSPGRQTKVGWKVGSTSASGQKAFGIQEPVYAGLFASDQSPSLTHALSRNLTSPFLECEILMILRQDIDPTMSDASIADAIAACQHRLRDHRQPLRRPHAPRRPHPDRRRLLPGRLRHRPRVTPTGAPRTPPTAAGFIEIDGQRRTGSA